MSSSENPADAIEEQALSFPNVKTGMSCNQTAFKVGKGTFLYLGPGPKGQGFKAMFKLKASMPDAVKLAEEQPKRFEVGTTGWVTTRFSAEHPLPQELWKSWLAESYDVTRGVAK